MQKNIQTNGRTQSSFLDAQEQQLKKQILANGCSPLYGEAFRSKQVNVDVQVLHEPEILGALGEALGVYQQELQQSGYTPLTINSYSSAVNRFMDFLEDGQVVPDFDNKPQH